MNRFKFILSIVFLTASSLSYAALAPMSEEKMKNEVAYIVVGKVLDVTKKVEKSKIETGFKDTIYTITVEVQGIAKGTGPKVGEKITVVAWTPYSEEPMGYLVEPKGTKVPVTRAPGFQGYDLIPKKGDTATFYLNGGGKEPYKPLPPNGMVLKKAE
jgi:hypothetical protein